jgi:hypothetical protein
MSKSLLAAIATTLALASTAYAAPSTPSVVTISPSSAQTQLSGKKIYVGAEELASIAGRYKTDKGQPITVSKEQNRLYVETTGVPKTELMPIAQNVFIAKSSDLKMKVTANNNGFDTDVVLEYTATKN